jgi:hypothetical protein
LFMEAMEWSAAGLRRQSRGFPGQHVGQRKLLISHAQDEPSPMNRTRNNQDISAEAVPPERWRWSYASA